MQTSDTDTYTVTIPDAMQGTRLDKALTLLLPDVSRARIQALLEAGAVTGRGSHMPRHPVIAGDTYTIIVPPATPSTLTATPMDLQIIYEDDALLVINKPAGLVVHPAPGHYTDTLANAMLAHCGDSLTGIGGVDRPGIVHRLDKDTSGLIIVAKTALAHQRLVEALQARSVKRTYLALVWGRVTPPAATITGNIARNSQHRQKMAVVQSGGKEAITHYETVQRFAAATLLQCQLETGRTHQIRVHLAHKGHPVVGDHVYSRKTRAMTTPAILANFPRQALHACALAFTHPISGVALEFTAPMPDDMCALIAALY